MGERLSSFIREFDVLIETYHPEKIYFEGIQYQGNVETYKKLAMIQAMIIYWSRQRQVESLELTPSH
jgi:Holliday junction resolvasome RuvABC endonuclease subunit